MTSLTQVLQTILYAPLTPVPPKCPHTSHPSHSIPQSHSVSSTAHEAPHYAVSCSQLFPNPSQTQTSPSTLYSQTPSIYVPHSVEGNTFYAEI